MYRELHDSTFYDALSGANPNEKRSDRNNGMYLKSEFSSAQEERQHSAETQWMSRGLQTSRF